MADPILDITSPRTTRDSAALHLDPLGGVGTDVGSHVGSPFNTGVDHVEPPRPTPTRVEVQSPLAAAVARPAAAPRMACGSAACRELRAEMHRFLDGIDIEGIPPGVNRAEAQKTRRAAELEAAGIDADWARRFVDQPNVEEPDLRYQFQLWQAACDEYRRRELESTREQPEPPVAGPGLAGPGVVATPLERSRIASPGQLSTADATSVRRDLRALGFATGARGAAGAWDADAFEGYRDFIERAVRAGKLTSEQAHSSRAADRAAVRTLLRNAARAPKADPALRATPAQTTVESTVAPEQKLVRVRKRWVLRPTGHRNRPEDVERVQRALLARGFFIDERRLRTYDATTQAAVQLYNASYRGLHERAGGSATLVSGAMMTRSLFGTPEETPHLVDGPRWGELQSDPTIGLRNYHTPGSSVTSWGTQRARQFVIDFARNLRTIRPDSEVLANDNSKREGGPHPFHSGHQVGMELDFTHPDEAEGQTRADWIEHRKQELLAMRPFASSIAFIYSSNADLVTYGRGLGLNMIQIGGHRMHFHVGIKSWTGGLARS
ncbi:MAG: hypothetical protein ACAI38_25720 [Myxococcota bacterium]